DRRSISSGCGKHHFHKHSILPRSARLSQGPDVWPSGVLGAIQSLLGGHLGQQVQRPATRLLVEGSRTLVQDRLRGSICSGGKAKWIICAREERRDSESKPRSSKAR